MRRSNSSAFSMIEVAVAIAIIAILAGAVAPLALKALNQQREQKTRENLKVAWEALFGAKDRRVANMRADFGFDPPAGANYNLGKMLVSTVLPAPNPPGTYALWGGAFYWGWNGPYWTGPTRTVGGVLVPVDAWGNSIQLRYVTAGPFLGFQLLSNGPNGVKNSLDTNYIPLGDDIVYPTQPQVLTTTYASTINLSFKNNRTTTLIGTYQVRWRNSTGTLSTSGPLDIGSPTGLPPGAPYTAPAIPNMPSGPIQVQIDITSGTTFSGTEVVDLLPGESRTLNYNF
jgi:prepilin-type N-terminal cleavage/methylation domain-containing protein